MRKTFEQIARLVSFMEKIESDTYPEPPSPIHEEITGNVLESFLPKFNVSKDSRILDVGCGQGPALELFRAKGYRSVTGIALNDEDVRVCCRNGHDVRKMDQSFLEFDDHAFDLIWARHVVEHSIFPLFTLAEFARVLAPNGMLYLEVPAPGTSCQHENNLNHYSVFGHSAWVALLERCGFTVLEDTKYYLTTAVGPDEYWGFIAQLTGS
jgi:SAM-dependent methyltransferase